MGLLKLFMVLVGGSPAGRHTEQHDVFFGIAETIEELFPEIKAFWPEIASKVHIDVWREVTLVDRYRIDVVPKVRDAGQQPHLYFINLGGYKQDDFEEYHYKMLVVAPDKTKATLRAKKAAFFHHTGFDQPHIDDKYGIDIDDLYELPEILPTVTKGRYGLSIREATPDGSPDILHIGYLPI